ncbi:MAG: protein O-mannosyl-transferase family [Gemmatimonadaceae bacterium]
MRSRLFAPVQRHPATVLAAVLLALYAITLAPSVTRWDSGEFLSAVRTLGIPHPPGTPLFVHAARAWSSLLGVLDFTVAVNLGSAVATAVAVALLVRTFLSWAGPGALLLSGVCAGSYAAVWQSATETEVYGYAFCLAAVMLAVGDHAGRRWSRRHRLLLAFLAGLAVPLHISALIAGPAAILLSAMDAGGSFSFRASLVPLAGWLVAVGVGTVSPLLTVLGLIVGIAAAFLPSGSPSGWRVGDGLVAVLLSLAGASFVLVMLVRAAHDPGVNQGDPSTWHALWDVVGRVQYDVPPLWPRRAPLWLQVGNVVQYADWQVAFGLSDAPGMSLLRTPVTLVFVTLGAVGATVQYRENQRAFRGHTAFLVCASLGAVAVLNLRAGPTYGWGVLPAGAIREARERDYFFAMAFASWGAWAGLGIVTLSRVVNTRVLRRVVWALAFMPVLLNWSATDRRRMPEARLARALGVSLLDAAPANAVLILAGDNDSYAVWYAQQVLGMRSDVVPITVPLLGADWYRKELRRRHRLLDSAYASGWYGTSATLRAAAAAAAARGRPFVVSAGISRSERRGIATRWRFTGISYVQTGRADSAQIDTLVVDRLRGTLASQGFTVRSAGGRDPAARYVQRLLLCVEAAARPSGARAEELTGLLETTCNY